MRADAPIGLFDSGVGGLTVLRTLLRRLPHEHTLYLGDTARVPYGTRSREVVTRYALMSGRFLAAQGIKALVVACNTVSAHSLPALAEAGWIDGEVPRLVAERYLGDLRRSGADTVLLGCTHYPLLSGPIAEVMGREVAIVDSAEVTAAAVEQLLAGRGLLRPEGGA